jgi:hypothetical protein
MLHQRRTSGKDDDSSAVNDNGESRGGLSLSMGDDSGGGYSAGGKYGRSSSGYASGGGGSGSGGGYGYSGYPQAQQGAGVAKQQRAGSMNSKDSGDKYRKRVQSTQSAIHSWVIYLLLTLALIVTIIFSKSRYTSLNSKYEALEKKTQRKTGYEDVDKDRLRQMEKDLKEARRAKSMAEGDQKKISRELSKAQKDLEAHETTHHHESSLGEEELALLDPAYQKFLKDKEAEFVKAYDSLSGYIQEESRREVQNW